MIYYNFILFLQVFSGNCNVSALKQSTACYAIKQKFIMKLKIGSFMRKLKLSEKGAERFIALTGCPKMKRLNKKKKQSLL